MGEFLFIPRVLVGFLWGFSPINQPRSQASRWEAMCVSPTGAVARGGEGFTDTWPGGGLGDEHQPYSFLGFWGRWPFL